MSSPGRVWVPRRPRQAVRLGALAVAVVALVAGIASLDLAPDLRHLDAVLLTGSEGGNYHRIGGSLSAAAAAQRGRLRAQVSPGSVDNLAQLVAASESCAVHYGLTQDGVDLSDGHPLELLGRLPRSESVLFLGRGADAIHGFADLRGMRIGVGPDGSGGAQLARKLLEVPAFGPLALRLEHHTLDEQLARLSRGELDLGVFVMDEDAPLIARAVVERGLSIASFDHLDVLARTHPFLGVGRIGAGQFDPLRVLPPDDRRVLRVDTLVVGNGCGSHAESVAVLELLSVTFPPFVQHNRERPPPANLPLSSTAVAFFRDGHANLADRYVPWLVNVMPPSNWAYVALAVSALFNAMGAGHRFRLWRIDAARVKAEVQVSALAGGLRIEDLEDAAPSPTRSNPQTLKELDDVLEALLRLRDRCRRHSLSVLVPMGQEMAYRYQEETIARDVATLRRYRAKVTASLSNEQSPSSAHV